MTFLASSAVNSRAEEPADYSPPTPHPPTPNPDPNAHTRTNFHHDGVGGERNYSFTFVVNFGPLLLEVTYISIKSYGKPKLLGVGWGGGGGHYLYRI